MKKVYCLTLQPYPNMQPVKDQVNQDKYRLVRAIAKCQRAKILPIRVRCSICLEISRITVIWNFLLFFSLKMIRNSSRQVRQLYAYVANESTRRLVEDGISQNSQTRTRLVDSLLCITCSLENNAFSVLHYVIKGTLHYLMLHGFEIHSGLELSRAVLFGCRLAASRLREAAR